MNRLAEQSNNEGITACCNELLITRVPMRFGQDIRIHDNRNCGTCVKECDDWDRLRIFLYADRDLSKRHSERLERWVRTGKQRVWFNRNLGDVFRMI